MNTQSLSSHCEVNVSSSLLMVEKGVLLCISNLSWCLSEVPGCDPDQFQCGNGLCIPFKWRCDGIRDCTDNSDEVCQCNPSEFECANGMCIDKSLVCNGRDNCGDESDEVEYACPGKLL